MRVRELSLTETYLLYPTTNVYLQMNSQELYPESLPAIEKDMITTLINIPRKHKV